VERLMSILGTRVQRLEDPRFLTGQGTYIANLPLPDAWHLSFVRSTIAHGRITAVDTSIAESMPGVIAVYTGATLPLQPAPPAMVLLNQKMLRPYLANDVVRYVGEPVAMIVSETKEQGVDAAESVIVDYDPLPTVLDLEESLRGDVLLHPDAGSNIAVTFPGPADASIFADCDVVVSLTIENQRVAPVPMEGRAAAATWDGSTLTQWACSQGVHGARDGIANALGLDPANVRAITPDVGGGFGAKSGQYPEEILVGWVAKAHGHAVRWEETRSENLVSMGHGRGQLQRAMLGGTKDGKFLAYRLEVLQDSGAYGRMGAVLPIMTRLMTSAVYDIPKVEYESNSVLTNTTPTEAYRGAGRPEATAAIERIIDVFAAKCGLDPADVRRRNFLQPSAFPLTTAMGAAYGSG